MINNKAETPKVDISFDDIQGLGTLPEPMNKLAGLVTKAAMGAFLAYFSLSELVIELKTYRENTTKRENAHG